MEKDCIINSLIAFNFFLIFVWEKEGKRNEEKGDGKDSFNKMHRTTINNNDNKNINADTYY